MFVQAINHYIGDQKGGQALSESTRLSFARSSCTRDYGTTVTLIIYCHKRDKDTFQFNFTCYFIINSQRVKFLFYLSQCSVSILGFSKRVDMVGEFLLFQCGAREHSNGENVIQAKTPLGLL